MFVILDGILTNVAEPVIYRRYFSVQLFGSGAIQSLLIFIMRGQMRVHRELIPAIPCLSDSITDYALIYCVFIVNCFVFRSSILG